MDNIVITLGGVELPDSNILLETTEPNETDVRTLDGTLDTDFINQLRGWTITWRRLSAANYDAIRAIFDAQYTNEAYPILLIPYYNIEVPVKVNISTKNIRFDGDCIIDFTITLQEQYAIS
jgi:hypothetical protein